MKATLTLLVLICLAIVSSLPAVAGEIYNNGPINGEVDAFSINFGFVVSDTFTISSGMTTVTGLSFGAWLTPGDTLDSIEVSISSMPDGGTVYFNGTVDTTQSGCFANNFGFDVCTETGSFNGPALGNGTYWLTLQNGVVSDGDPVYWDENSGTGCTSPGCPSQGFNQGIGSIPSEAFTLMGNSGTGTVPEPDSLMLFASGVLAFAAVVRRKLS